MSNQVHFPMPASVPTSHKAQLIEVRNAINELHSMWRQGQLTSEERQLVVRATEAFNKEQRDLEAAIELIFELGSEFSHIQDRLTVVEKRVSSVERDVDNLGRQVRLVAERTTSVEDEVRIHGDILAEALPKLERLQASGGSVSNQAQLFIAGFTDEEIKVLNAIRAHNPEYTDEDHFVEVLLGTVRKADNAWDLASANRTAIAANTQGITDVNARVDKQVTYINQLDTGGNFWIPFLVGVVVALLSIPFVVRALDNGLLEVSLVIGFFLGGFAVASEFANRRKKRELLEGSPAAEVDKTEEVVVVEERQEVRKPFRTKVRNFFVNTENNDQSTKVVSNEVTDQPQGSSAPAVEPNQDEAGYALPRR